MVRIRNHGDKERWHLVDIADSVVTLSGDSKKPAANVVALKGIDGRVLI